MRYNLYLSEAQKLVEKLEEDGYLAFVIPDGDNFNVLITHRIDKDD